MLIHTIKLKLSVIKIICLVFTLIYCTISYSQTQKSWQWANKLGSNSWDISSGITIDSKGSLYLTGIFQNEFISGAKSIIPKGDKDGFIAKYNNDGVIKELKSFGGFNSDGSTSICMTNDDKIAITGYITDSVWFDKFKVPGKNRRLFVAEFDNTLKLSWITTIEYIGDAYTNLLGADQNGYIYAAGYFTGTLSSNGKKIESKGGKDIFIAKVSSNGSITEFYSLGSEADDILTSLAVDPSGNIVLAGKFGSLLEATNLKLIPKEKSNHFIIKTDDKFNIKWSSTLYCDDYCDVSSIKLDDIGNIYAGGTFNSNLNLSDTLLVSKGYTDGFLLQINKEGNTNWIRSFGSWYYDYFKHINVDNLGGAIISGSLGDQMLIDSLSITPKPNSNSGVVLQFSKYGKAIWGDYISGNGNSSSSGSVLDKKGSLYFAGIFRGEFEKNQKKLTSSGDQDVFLAKYINCFNSKADIFGVLSFCDGFNTELSTRKTYNSVIWNDTIPDKFRIVVDKPGLNWLRVLDKKGCVLTDTVHVIRNNSPLFSLGNDTTLFTSDSLILKAPLNYIVDNWQDYSTNKEYVAKSEDSGKKDYWLKVVDSVGCVFTDSISLSFVKDSKRFDFETIKLTVHPNPTSDVIYWSINTQEECRLNIELSNEIGIKYYHQVLGKYIPGEENRIDMSHFSKGVYYLKITEFTSQITKIIIILKQ
jgi:hypothetical protein